MKKLLYILLVAPLIAQAMSNVKTNETPASIRDYVTKISECIVLQNKNPKQCKLEIGEQFKDDIKRKYEAHCAARAIWFSKDLKLRAQELTAEIAQCVDKHVSKDTKIFQESKKGYKDYIVAHRIMPSVSGWTHYYERTLGGKERNIWFNSRGLSYEHPCTGLCDEDQEKSN